MIRKIIHLLQILILAAFVGVTVTAGELDSDFGVDGRVSIEIGTHGDRAQAIAIQPDGRILLGGSSTDGDSLGCSLIRLLADGSPDPSFNGDGTVLLDVSTGDDEILALGLAEDGRIIAGGYSHNGADRDFILLRFNTDGSPDTEFGNQGTVITSVGNGNDEITALVVDDSGSILVAGSAEGTKGRVIVLARFLADGTPDASFADQGSILIGIGRDVLAQGMVVDPDGRIIISGSYSDGDATRMILVGFTADGRLDDTFGEQGVATTLFSRQFSEGYGIFQEQDGTFYVAGSVGPEGERAAALFRFSSRGVPDASFGEDGVLISEIGPEDDVLYGLDGNDSQLSAAGFTTTNGSRDFLLITYTKMTAGRQDASEARSEEDSSMFHISELQVEDSYDSYTAKADAADSALEASVMTTTFGQGESVSYAVAVQDDGKVVTAGTTGDYGQSSAVVARFGWVTTTAGGPSSVDDNLYIATNIPTDVTATQAFTGGFIHEDLEINQGASVTQRGVVYSISPHPTCDSDCASGLNPEPPSPDVGPVVSNPEPSGTITTTSTTLSVTTDVEATCKYTDSGAGMDYSLMRSTFDTTGGTTHSEPLTVQDGQSYTYYVRCQSTATGIANTSDTVISFSVNTSGPGPGPDAGPVRSNPQPAYTITTNSTTLKIDTDVAATCNLSTTPGVDYFDMQNSFDTTGGTLHEEPVTGLTEGPKTYYVRCRNSSTGDINTTDYEISFIVNLLAGPEVSNPQPTGTIATNSPILEVSTDQAANCNLSITAGVDYFAMQNSFETTGGTLHKEPVSGLSEKIHKYYVRCRNTATGAVNTTDTVIEFTVNTGAPNISDLKPSGTVATASPTIKVVTDVVATCKYATVPDVDYNNMDDFDNTGGTSHDYSVTPPLTDGEKHYYVRCENSVTKVVNVSDAEITFTVDTNSASTLLNTFDKTETLLAGVSAGVGNFLLPSAHAVDVTNPIEPGDPTTPTPDPTPDTDSYLNKGGYTIDGSGSGVFGSILEKLTPDTKYYVRAYAIVNGRIFYGPQVDFETGSACFIATAAYGSMLHPAVAVLRDFRDRFLTTSSFGRQLVGWYYKNSPPIADKIAASESLRLLTRAVLLPLIAVSWLLLHPAAGVLFITVICLTGLWFRSRRHHLVTL